MSNNECITNLENKISLEIKSQIDDLDSSIASIKAANAAKGLLRSSHTIKTVIKCCIEAMDKRSSFICDAVEKLPFQYKLDLFEQLKILLKNIFLRMFMSLPDGLRKLHLWQGAKNLLIAILELLRKVTRAQ